MFKTEGFCVSPRYETPSYKYYHYLVFENRFTNKTLTSKNVFECKDCVFLDVGHKAIPYRASSINCATRNLHSFCRLPVWRQNLDTSITRHSWEKKIPKMFPSSLIYGLKASESSLQSDQKWSLQRGLNFSAVKAPLPAMEKKSFFVQLCRQNNQSEKLSVLLNHQ